MRMRHNEHFQFVMAVPLMIIIVHSPSLLPLTAVRIVERQLIVYVQHLSELKRKKRIDERRPLAEEENVKNAYLNVHRRHNVSPERTLLLIFAAERHVGMNYSFVLHFLPIQFDAFILMDLRLFISAVNVLVLDIVYMLLDFAHLHIVLMQTGFQFVAVPV